MLDLHDLYTMEYAKKMMRIMVDVKLASIMEIAIIVLIAMKALNINLI